MSQSTTSAERDITLMIDAVDLIQAQVDEREMTFVPDHLLTELQHAAQMVLDASSTLKEGRVVRMKDTIDLLQAQEATLKKLLNIRIPAATANSPEGTPTQSTPVSNWQQQIVDGNRSQEEENVPVMYAYLLSRLPTFGYFFPNLGSVESIWDLLNLSGICVYLSCEFPSYAFSRFPTFGLLIFKKPSL
ncbi:hypothetical protein R1sor_005785 [Riccia sorocarpa]|uniref:Uncharacterized protein n=1 Tax=Riccia sorocarpa TaxID=122646 RepID=A0ABD3HS21_9MARC